MNFIAKYETETTKTKKKNNKTQTNIMIKIAIRGFEKTILPIIILRMHTALIENNFRRDAKV